MTDAKIRVLVGCQHEPCAEEVSFHLDMVRKWRGLPVCEVCWKEVPEVWGGDLADPQPDWHDLPPVKMSDLIE